MANDLTQLLRFIETRFNLEEFRTLCLDLDVNYDNLAGETLHGKARELVLRLRREERLSELLDRLRDARPEAFAPTGLETTKDIDRLSSKDRPVWPWVAGTVLGLVLLVGLAWGIRSVTFTPTSTPTPTFVVCTPSDLSELPPQSIAIIESLESGEKSQAAFNTLRYEHLSGLRLASGMTIEFKRMKRFELTNPDFTEDFAADVEITFLDCRVHRDRIQSESGSYLTAETEFGPLELHILKIKRVDFRW